MSSNEFEENEVVEYGDVIRFSENLKHLKHVKISYLTPQFYQTKTYHIIPFMIKGRENGDILFVEMGYLKELVRLSRRKKGQYECKITQRFQYGQDEKPSSVRYVVLHNKQNKPEQHIFLKKMEYMDAIAIVAKNIKRKSLLKAASRALENAGEEVTPQFFNPTSDFLEDFAPPKKK
ncbi:hypothetical protein RFI_26154 [Reticulomyxa filosa]|uniref:Uncharacterized protein n=1 Tax=Reticulomyxa filosa TaxID=46433 RepID=X6MC18_RETFI|nr:hypothetical protein RFI_26154 [Reticulomyxa filosa]|eukprot:ETO11221.1 hypothetical protein RFI_26154 [Reticulomyxa filosa]